MRFHELHLVRYGHFEDHILTFPQSLPDLQVVRGANEAGKSTMMAAVSDLLFGFPHKTLYDFRYPTQLLRVGAVLDATAGDLVVRRKKGRQNTLLDFNDRPIDEGPLLALLAGQEREAFERMFSLDHERLRAGGRAILEAEDDAGRVIFEAGSGLAGITSLANALGEEAERIWTPTARRECRRPRRERRRRLYGRAHLRRHVGGIDDVLHTDRHAMERSSLWRTIEQARISHHHIGIAKGPRAHDRLPLRDAIEAIARDRFAGLLAPGDGSLYLSSGELPWPNHSPIASAKCAARRAWRQPACATTTSNTSPGRSTIRLGDDTAATR